MTFRIRGRYPATASLCKTWATNVGFAAPVSGPTSPESLATPLSLSLTPASIADTRALLSLDEEGWPQREQRLALRGLRGRARRPGAPAPWTSPPRRRTRSWRDAGKIESPPKHLSALQSGSADQCRGDGLTVPAALQKQGDGTDRHVLSAVGEAPGPAGGELQVARALGRETCSGVIGGIRLTAARCAPTVISPLCLLCAGFGLEPRGVGDCDGVSAATWGVIRPPRRSRCRRAGSFVCGRPTCR